MAYGSDTELVTNTLLEIANANTLILDDPEPAAFFLGFGASSLDFELRVFVNNFAMRLPLMHELHLEIDRRRNLVRYIGPQNGANVWLQLVRSLDMPRTQLDDQTRLVPVKKADPLKVQKAVSLIRAASDGNTGDTTTAVKAVGDARINVVMATVGASM